jgi:alkyl hydroperoxide reductase subunit AhpF
MEPLLDDSIKDQVKTAFEQMKEPVRIVFFEKQDNCETCESTRQLLEEVSALHDLISLEVHDLEADAELAQKYNIDKAPVYSVARIVGDEIVDYGIRYAGIPSGSEFSTLIHDILLVSAGDSNLKVETREFLRNLTEPVSLLVFVTPT